MRTAELLALEVSGDYKSLKHNVLAWREEVGAMPDVLFWLGVAHARLDEFQEAKAILGQAVQLDGNNADAWNQYGLVLNQLTELAEAEAAFSRALALAPESVHVRVNFAKNYLDSGKLQKCIKHCRMVLAHAPNHPQATANYANALIKLGQEPQAKQVIESLHVAGLATLETRQALAVILLKEGNLSAAYEQMTYVVNRKPTDIQARRLLCTLLESGGEANAADKMRQEMLRTTPSAMGVRSDLLFSLNARGLGKPEERLQWAREYGSRLEGKSTNIANHVIHDIEGPLIIGFVSADFRDHPVAYFLEGMLRHINRQKCRLIALNNSPKSDETTSRLRQAFDQWFDIASVGNQEVARLVQENGVHCLIDLSGHTAGQRLSLFAMRPAPLLVSWLGYFSTTGLSAMDYVLMDPVSVPIGAEAEFVESVWRLPDTRLCFNPPTNAPEVAPLPALARGYVTFGVYQPLSKTNDEVISLWRAILSACPNARLRIQNKQLMSESIRESFCQRLEVNGIDGNRVDLVGPMSRVAYLESYAEVDLVLDTFPYPGGTTTCEALWMGVPTLTICGETALARQGAMINSAAGLHDWIASTVADVVQKVTELSGRLQDLSHLRAQLRAQVSVSPLMDARRFARNFLHSLQAMWAEKHRAMQPAVCQRDIAGSLQGADGAGSSNSMNLDAMAVLAQIKKDASAGRFQRVESLLSSLLDTPSCPAEALYEAGNIGHQYGFLAMVTRLFEKAQTLAPDDLRATVNLANVLRDSGDHTAARHLYADLLARLPNHPVIRRNALTGLEYDPDVTDAERLAQAQAWGEWAITQAGGQRPRPPLTPLTNRPLRIGYVSADLCQHTVGLFVKDILKAHDPRKVAVFAYSAGTVEDWVNQQIRNALPRGHFCDIRALDDAALAERIRQDRIDLLIDLSGHTAGSRLTAFAYRPAPVMVSWLGYFATSGLAYIDAVLLDKWHAPPGTEARFAEPIMRLPQRLCYTPVPFAPAVSPAPTFTKGHISFGSFNNTAKYNPAVFDLWARILGEVPNSCLILKWRTFNDAAFQDEVRNAFVQRGIAAERIELRGPSFHADLLKEYADIDIALDPFPFTGGLTSCEALWMGVPVITWPQSRVVSRQTYAFLNQIGLPELAAKDAEDYVRIAVKLAHDKKRLLQLRGSLRQRMQASPLCNVTGFTRNLEDSLIQLYENIAQSEQTMTSTPPKILLNVGAGHPKSGARIPDVFQSPEWKEVRLDIDPANEPDVIGTMLDMSAVADESVDAIYSSHTIEHLYPNEIPQAMKEFLRVLKPEGYAVITCPDLQAAAEMIVQDKLMEVAYNSPAGPVTPFDIVYSHRMFTDRDKPYMAHHCGFTLTVLSGTLRSNGFAMVAGKRRPKSFDLWVVASKGPMDETTLRELAGKVLPG